MLDRSTTGTTFMIRISRVAVFVMPFSVYEADSFTGMSEDTLPALTVLFTIVTISRRSAVNVVGSTSLV